MMEPPVKLTPPDRAAGLRVLLVDDEELARWRLRGLVNECSDPRATVVGEAASTAEALAWLASDSCDLLLLDVGMPGRDGTQLAAELRKRDDSPAVVFVTAHAEHALTAFDLDAVDYLTKPVRRERLHAALQRVVQRIGRLADQAPERAGADESDPRVIVVSDRGRVVRVPLTEVLYFKAELKYVTLRTVSHTFVLDDALSDLEQRVGDRFLRVHRNALVARGAVRALERRSVPGGALGVVPSGALGGAPSGALGVLDEEGGGTWYVQVAPVGEWLVVSRRQVSAVREALTRSTGA